MFHKGYVFNIAGRPAERARAAGLAVVMGRCILKEYAKRFVAERI